MLFSQVAVDLARAQFGFTAICHFLFVPLTIGLPWLLLTMELLHIYSGKLIYSNMIDFWKKIFLINLLFDFIAKEVFKIEYKLYWPKFSHIINQLFGTTFTYPDKLITVAIVIFACIYFFTWKKISYYLHLLITVFLTIFIASSIVNPIVMNSWMQHPVACYFDLHTMTFHVSSLLQIYIQPQAYLRILHMFFASLLVSSMFMLGTSSYYLLKNERVDFALHSFSLALIIGLIACVSIFVSGDSDGLLILKDEPEKMAALEGQWNTQIPPAAWYVIAIPDQIKQENRFVIEIPYALSLIATHSLIGTVEGLKDRIAANTIKIRRGILANNALAQIHLNNNSAENMRIFQQNVEFLGYGALLNKYTENHILVTSEQIQRAANDSVPQMSIVFWAFRVMLYSWGICSVILIMGLYLNRRKRYNRSEGCGGRHHHHIPSWYLRFAFYTIPVPYIAAEAGWVLAEAGRQPWLVYGIVPTFSAASTLPALSIGLSLIGFSIFFLLVLFIYFYFMFTYGYKRNLPPSL